MLDRTWLYATPIYITCAVCTWFRQQICEIISMKSSKTTICENLDPWEEFSAHGVRMVLDSKFVKFQRNLQKPPFAKNLDPWKFSPIRKQHCFWAFKQRFVFQSLNDFCFLFSQLTRDLDHCHDELRRLNQLLAEKKEYVLKYQEKISDHQSENVALKQENTAMKQEILALKQRQAVTNQVAAPGVSHDSALQLQVCYCNIYTCIVYHVVCTVVYWHV